MVHEKIYQIDHIDDLKRKVLNWGRSFGHFFYFDTNSESYSKQRYDDYELIAGIGAISIFEPNRRFKLNDLQSFLDKESYWYFCLISYDLKNHIENLRSENQDFVNWPILGIVVPEQIILIKEKEVRIVIQAKTLTSPDDTIRDIRSTKDHRIYSPDKVEMEIKSRISKEEYLETANQLIQHIRRGDIYEINFCQEFYSFYKIDPLNIYKELLDASPTPFSAYLRYLDNYLICASPERYIKKMGNKIISQPIKGTAARGKTPNEDLTQLNHLRNDAKEISENVMIVDLVRNDLSRIAIPKSVNVEELCGIYPFRQVYQMISTISAEIEDKSFTEILKSTFPMGSMTGAPKIKAMELAEKYERTKRGLYSGAVGYIDPKGNFDFNVVIRSLQYNAKTDYLSYMVGSALTIRSDPEREYNECLLKASAIEEVLSKKSVNA